MLFLGQHTALHYLRSPEYHSNLCSLLHACFVLAHGGKSRPMPDRRLLSTANQLLLPDMIMLGLEQAWAWAE
jgi:type VI protein secretion system component VasF